MAVTDCFVTIVPFSQATVDVVFISHDQGPRCDRFGDNRFDRLLFDIWQHLDDDLAAAFDHPQHGRLLFFQRAAPAFPFQSTLASGSPFWGTASGWPLCPATM